MKYRTIAIIAAIIGVLAIAACTTRTVVVPQAGTPTVTVSPGSTATPPATPGAPATPGSPATPAAPAGPGTPVAPASYAQDIADAGIAAPTWWLNKTGPQLCVDWENGESTAQTDQQLLAGGIHANHLGTFDSITRSDVCPSQ